MELRAPDFGQIRAVLARERERFDLFFSLLTEYNARFNLTSITDPAGAEIKHFADSLAGMEYFPKGALVAEVGSGAGFPSIPLMIARGDLSFRLFESVGKKCGFLRIAAERLGLSAEIVQMRAEDAGRDPAFRERHDVCCARAVARLDTLAEYCVPLVRRGGTFIAYKGAESEKELAKNALSLLGCAPAEEVFYDLPCGMGKRNLTVSKKRSATPPAYPRGRGAERRDPL